jgi:hypothetical protein
VASLVRTAQFLLPVTNIHRKLNELKRLERALSAMVDDTSDCPILDALAT